MGVSCSLSEKGLRNLEMEKKMNPVRLDCDWCYQCVVIVFNVCNCDRNKQRCECVREALSIEMPAQRHPDNYECTQHPDHDL